MKRGEIYFIKSNHNEIGSEQRADRPAVIVSNDKNNEHSETVEIVYLTTKPKTDLPTHVLTRSALSPSTILCESVCTVSKKRVKEWIGTLTDGEMKSVDAALAISLGLDFEQSSMKCPSDCPGKVTTETTVMREPTEEEIMEIVKEMHENGKLTIPEPEPSSVLSTDQTADLIHEAIKAKAERDVYKELYLDLLEHMKGTTN